MNTLSLTLNDSPCIIRDVASDQRKYCTPKHRCFNLVVRQQMVAREKSDHALLMGGKKICVHRRSVKWVVCRIDRIQQIELLQKKITYVWKRVLLVQDISVWAAAGSRIVAKRLQC